MIILYIAIFLFLGYIFLINYYWWAWRSIPEYVLPAKRSNAEFSVVIPARNEEKNIIHCLESICHQDYPSEFVEIIAVDDSSSDKTWKLLQEFSNGERKINTSYLAEVDG